MQNVKVSLVRKILRRFIGIHRCNLDTEQATGKRISFGLIVASSSSVIPSEVEESLDYSWVSKHIEICLDSARRDNRSFFAVEIIRFVTLDNDTIPR
jgi:hypothetical protein